MSGHNFVNPREFAKPSARLTAARIPLEILAWVTKLPGYLLADLQQMADNFMVPIL